MARTILLTVLLMATTNSFATIKNGYEPHIIHLMSSLEKLTAELKASSRSTLAERSRLKMEIDKITDIVSCYELTAAVIRQLKDLSPDIYHEMNSIVDRRNRPTDIFIKLIPAERSKVPYMAASYFNQSKADGDASVSEYGEHSVSVKICIASNSLLMLYHELGHIQYVVPNLAGYAETYKKYYRNKMTSMNSLGHDRNDKSGQLAHLFEAKYARDFAEHKRKGGDKLPTAAALYHTIRRGNDGLIDILNSEDIITMGL